MLYTLAKFFVWGLGFAVIGGVIGWSLRSIRCRRELAVARRTTVDEMEVDRLRHRVANLEPIVADRDSMRQQIADLERQLKAAAGAAPAATDGAAVPAMQGFAAVGGAEEVGATAAPIAAGFGVDLDLDAARSVFGKSIAADDLKIVEGIGPVLEGVLQAGGITTWAGLGAASPEAIRSVLIGADERHRMHDPSSWPRQARLAAIGEWDALKALQDLLTAGRD